MAPGRRHEAVAREIRRAVKSQLRRRVGCLLFKATLLHIHCTITSSCTLPVKLLLGLQLKATDLRQLLCRRYTPVKSQNVLKPKREHCQRCQSAVFPSIQRGLPLCRPRPLGPPLGTQIHSKWHLHAQCVQRCAREQSCTRKVGPLAAQGC